MKTKAAFISNQSNFSAAPSTSSRACGQSSLMFDALRLLFQMLTNFILEFAFVGRVQWNNEPCDRAWKVGLHTVHPLHHLQKRFSASPCTHPHTDLCYSQLGVIPGFSSGTRLAFHSLWLWPQLCLEYEHQERREG